MLRSTSGSELFESIFTHFMLETPKRITGKQCRSRADAVEYGCWWGSTLFALTTENSIKHSNNKKAKMALYPSPDYQTSFESSDDRAMIRQICNVRPQDIVTTRSSELLVQLGIEDLDLILKERRLRWYGHVECSNGAVKTAFDIQVDGKRGRPKMTWKQLTERDCREWKLSVINPHDRHSWKSGVGSAMRAASQLSGRGHTGVDVAPVPAC